MSLFIPEFIEPLLAHPVAIFGGGVSGQAVRALIGRLGGTGVIFDQKGADGALTEFRGSAASAHHLVVYSPGFPPTHPWIAEARSTGAVCLAELDFASLFWRGSLVAITGTNGKTTLTEFLTHALRSIGRDAYATGNIGFSFAQLVADHDGGAPDSIAICEVSSFQSETLRYFRADAALWTNFAEDHLERHGTMEQYFLAKWRLFERSVGGHVFAGSSVQRYADKFGQTIPAESHVTTEGQSGDVLLRGTVFAHYPQRENFIIAAAWWRSQGLRETALYAAAQSFSLGEHRLARVAMRGGVTWWNDSKATNFHAVEAAVAGFAAPVILIAGGKSKGGDVAAFVNRLVPMVKRAYFIGETRNVLATFAGSCGLPHTVCADLGEAVRRASEIAVSGDNILLSPGFSSFDQFKSYEDRGKQFVALVNNVGATVV
ncbi:MAG: UDP-N-acetylmuramoyl-L-alanine--D-glutamate ligase [Opitutaceae bacterium]|jgi:UDP-N-acetylmuramoylalanine--D-glutamate ligase